MYLLARVFLFRDPSYFGFDVSAMKTECTYFCLYQIHAQSCLGGMVFFLRGSDSGLCDFGNGGAGEGGESCS